MMIFARGKVFAVLVDEMISKVGAKNDTDEPAMLLLNLYLISQFYITGARVQQVRCTTNYISKTARTYSAEHSTLLPSIIYIDVEHIRSVRNS